MQLWRGVTVMVAGRCQACWVPRGAWLAGARRLINTSQYLTAKKKRASILSKQQPQSNHLQQLVLADTHYIEKQKNEILKTFPKVRNTIKNMFNNLSSNMNKNYSCDEKTTALGRIKNQLVYQCSITLTWPHPVTFTGYGFNKKNAELSATVKTAEMLYKGNYIAESGYPVTASLEERQLRLREWNQPPRITIPLGMLQEGFTLLREYQEEVEPLMEKVLAEVTPPLPGLGLEAGDEEGLLGVEEDKEGMSQRYTTEEDRQHHHQQEEVPLNLLTGKRDNQHQQGEASYRSNYLHHLLEKRRQHHNTAAQKEERKGRPALPMLQYRNELLTTLHNKRVLVVSGDTGCGKSTQVPQMILDEWVSMGRGAECNIIVTQPRRISAISLAKRVAREREEALGDSIGYHMRLEHRPIKGSGGVMFCTTGMLLQGLHSNPKLAGASHVIVDEVHERSVQTDILLILLRRLLRQRPSLRLILMSASISKQEILHYFEEEEAGLIEVPGTLYPLTRHYLPASLEILGINPRRHSLEALMEPESLPFVNVDLIVDVIRAIDRSRPPGAVLCFLPGWQDIAIVQNKLQNDLGQKLCVLPLHSRLPTEEQEQIFEPPPPGKRKVVLSTNLAETSLTVTDVVYVVDAGFHKEHRYNSKKDLSILGNHWISRASSQQRAGRAGRVQAGEVFHLYSSEVHRDMSQYPVPEIMRIPLEHVILQCKAHCGNEGVRSFLAEGMSVPSRRLISAALNTLEKLGMLTPDPKEATEHLTALGSRVTHFSTPPHMSKAMVWGSLFKCLDPVLSITAVLCGGRSLFHNSIDHRAKTREVKATVDPTSDLLAQYGLQRAWQKCEGYEEKLQFCNKHNLSHRYLRFNEGIKQVYATHLCEAQLLDREYVRSRFSRWNAHGHNAQLVLGALLAGAGRVLHYHRGSYFKGILNPESLAIKTEKGEHIATGSDCVLHQPPKNITALPRHLLCLYLNRDAVSRRTVARDLSLLQPLTVALFAGEALEVEEEEDGTLYVSVDGRDKCSFLVDRRTGHFLLQLREVLDTVVGYMVDTRGLHATPYMTDRFCDDLVKYVSELLMTHGQKKTKVDEDDYEDEVLSYSDRRKNHMEKW